MDGVERETVKECTEKEQLARQAALFLCILLFLVS